LHNFTTQIFMTNCNSDIPAALCDFSSEHFAFDGIAKRVYVAGTGPAVLVLTEMPGISPEVIRFARWVRDAGFTVWLPSLFGRDGVTESAEEAVAIFKRTCISAEFRALEAGGGTPIVSWLRQLAQVAHGRCGGPGVGAVGMCFTGNFAVSLILRSPMLAAVACQPTLPMDDPAGMGLPDEEIKAIRERIDREDLRMQGYRFEGDRWCSAARFAAYQQAFGQRFEAIILPDSAAHPEPPPFFKHVVQTPHSVVTAHLIDAAGQPTLAARDRILDFMRTQLSERLPDATRTDRA
jgi:dienelactone hydrolase